VSSKSLLNPTWAVFNTTSWYFFQRSIAVHYGITQFGSLRFQWAVWTPFFCSVVMKFDVVNAIWRDVKSTDNSNDWFWKFWQALVCGKFECCDSWGVPEFYSVHEVFWSLLRLLALSRKFTSRDSGFSMLITRTIEWRVPHAWISLDFLQLESVSPLTLKLQFVVFLTGS